MAFDAGFIKLALAPQSAIKAIGGVKAVKSTAAGLGKMEQMGKKPGLFRKPPAAGGKTMQEAQQHIATLPNAQAGRLERKLYDHHEAPAPKAAPAPQSSGSANSPSPSKHVIAPQGKFGLRHVVGAGIGGVVLGNMAASGSKQQQQYR